MMIVFLVPIKIQMLIDVYKRQGKARNIDELRADILKAASYIPGTHRLNLHEIYGDFQRKVVDLSLIHI